MVVGGSGVRVPECSAGETDALRAPSAFPQDAAARRRCVVRQKILQIPWPESGRTGQALMLQFATFPVRHEESIVQAGTGRHGSA